MTFRTFSDIKVDRTILQPPLTYALIIAYFQEKSNKEGKKMKVDYVFLKDLLNEMQSCDSFMIQTDELISFLYSDAKYTSEDEFMDKFFGHLNLLADVGAIEALVGNNFGATYSLNKLSYHSAVIRLTSQGNNFAETLNNKHFFEKIKKMTIGISFELCKDILMDTARQLISKGL